MKSINQSKLYTSKTPNYQNIPCTFGSVVFMDTCGRVVSALKRFTAGDAITYTQCNSHRQIDRAAFNVLLDTL